MSLMDQFKPLSGDELLEALERDPEEESPDSDFLVDLESPEQFLKGMSALLSRKSDN